MRHFETTFEITFFLSVSESFSHNEAFLWKEKGLDAKFEFLGAAHGFHVYRDIWRYFQKGVLKCDSEIGNLFDMFAIKVCRSSDHYKIIYHLSREVLRPRKFLIDLGKRVTTTVRWRNIRMSPVLLMELEILCRVKVVIPKALKKWLLLDRNCKMVHELYEELEMEIIAGAFDNTEK